MNHWAEFRAQPVCVLALLCLLITSADCAWTYSVEVSGLTAGASHADAAVMISRIELPYSLLSISLHPWKHENNERLNAFPELDFLLQSADGKTLSAGDIEFSGFLSLYSEPGKHVLFRDICGDSLQISPADSLDETAVLVPIRFGADGDRREGLREHVYGSLYAGGDSRSIGFELRRKIEHAVLGWNVNLSHTGGVLHRAEDDAEKNSEGVQNQFTYENRAETPFTLFHSIWVSASVPSLRFFFGTGRRESLADAGEQWFVMAAGISEANFSADAGIYIAPDGAADYCGKTNSVICASEAEISAELNQCCTWKLDWRYALQSPVPWNTLNTYPGSIDWETEFAFFGCSGEGLKHELSIQYGAAYEAAYYAYSKESLNVDRDSMLSVCFSGNRTSSPDRYSVKSTAVLTNTELCCRDQLHQLHQRKNCLPGVEEIRQTFSLKKGFQQAGMTGRISLKYAYNCLSGAMESAVSSFEVEKDCSWGTLSAELENLESLQLSCSVSIDL